MKAFIWKLRYTWFMKFYVDSSWKFAWGCSEAWVESFGIEDYTPKQAVIAEVDCWYDCVDLG